MGQKKKTNEPTFASYSLNRSSHFTHSFPTHILDENEYRVFKKNMKVS